MSTKFGAQMHTMQYVQLAISL